MYSKFIIDEQNSINNFIDNQYSCIFPNQQYQFWNRGINQFLCNSGLQHVFLYVYFNPYASVSGGVLLSSTKLDEHW
jgi:hypothetical protein